MPTGAASGTIVIDIDIKNGRDGTIDLKQLQSELGPLPDTLTSLTPSGGEHRFFQDPGGIRSTDKLGRGIDVKAGGGYVVVPPSHGSYRWQDELRQPAELPEAWVVHVRSLAGSSGHSSKQPSADVRDIAAALQVIPNDNLPWEGWNRIAMATWRATGGSEAGLAAFDSFSRKSGKYDADTTRKRWHEIGRSPPRMLGAGTIFFLADQARPGWRGARTTNGSDIARTTDSSDALSDRHYDWENPDLSLLEDRRGELPQFPLDTLRPDWLRNWVKRAAQGTGTTIGHVAVPLLGIAAGLVGTARRVRATSGWSEPATLWTMTGKTPALDATRKPLAQLELDRETEIQALRRTHDAQKVRAAAAHKQWEAAVKEAVERAEASPPPPRDEDPGEFVEPRLYSSDVTIERMGVLLQARPHGMLLLTDELSGWFANMSRYSGGTDKQFWLMAWDGRPHSIDRVGRPSIRLQNLLVGVIGGSQPAKLPDCFGKAADGMSARFLFSWPPEPPYRELRDIIAEIDELIVAMLDSLAQLGEQRRVLSLTAAARGEFERLRHWVHEQARLLDGPEREWLAKAPAQVLRLADTLTFLCWAANGGGDEPADIKQQCVAAAARLVSDYFWPHARAVLRQIGLTPRGADERRVLRWIAGAKRDQVSLQDVRRGALAQKLDAKETLNLLAALEGAGWLRKTEKRQGAAGGRPIVRWEVNRQLWGRGDG